MASMTKSLLQKMLVKYGGIPNQEAVLIANELDETRVYDTAAALVADLANVDVGDMAYAIDTEEIYMRGASAFIKVASPLSDSDAFLIKKTVLTAAQVKALAATQITLVAAVAGKLIMHHDTVMQLVAGTEVFTETTDNMIINYVDAAGVAATGAIEATGFIDQLTNQHNLIKGVAIPVGTTAQLVNTPLVLDNTGDGEYGGNASDDALLNVWCRYSLIDVD